MVELSLYLSKQRLRYVFWIGHGSPEYGQIAFISLTREEWDSKGNVYWATQLFSLGGSNGNTI